MSLRKVVICATILMAGACSSGDSNALSSIQLEELNEEVQAATSAFVDSAGAAVPFSVGIEVDMESVVVGIPSATDADMQAASDELRRIATSAVESFLSDRSIDVEVDEVLEFREAEMLPPE